MAYRLGWGRAIARVVPCWMTAVWQRRLHLGVRSKLIGAFILTNGTIVIGMIVFLQWSFGRGFLDYLHQTEARHLDAIGVMLAQQYTVCGDGQFLRHNPRRWFHLLGTLQGEPTPDAAQRPPPDSPSSPCDALPEGGPGPLPHRFPPPPWGGGARAPHDHPWLPRDALPEAGPGPLPRRPSPIPSDPLFLGPRLSVLDAEHQLVVGGRRDSAHATLRPIRQHDRVIGWLRLTPLPAVTDELDR